LLEVLIKNILENAYKYNKNNWKITIELNQRYLSIKDSWIWIKKENIYQIFDSFYRVENSVKWYGVWLNIVKKISDILKYKIEVKSEIKEWTEFKIFF
jgi:signal transduction histidine kinase